MTAIFALTFAAAAQAGGDTAPNGLPVPRFVSLKVERVNVRGGPDKDHDVAWIYTRVGWPVEITAEFENWRRIRDSDGSEGWVYHSLLSGKRMAVVQLKSKTDLALLHAKPDAESAVLARLQSGVLGSIQPSKPSPVSRHQLPLQCLTDPSTPDCKRASTALSASGLACSGARSVFDFSCTTAMRVPDSSE